MRRKTTAALILVLGLATGCDRQERGSGGTADNFPEPVRGEGDATVSRRLGSIGQSGGKNVVVDLEKIPEHGSPNLWSCFNIPADDFVFGRLICSSDTNQNADLVAANIDFTCEIDPDFGVRKATITVNFSQCPNYEVFPFVFKPNLTMRISE